MTHKKPMSPRAKDMNYVNKGEDYEVYYAKKHPSKRTGYKNVEHAEKGGTKKMSSTPKPKTKSKFGKGKTTAGSAGSLKETNYLSKYKIKSIETTSGKTIGSSNIIDGAYIKKGVKFGKGGGVDGLKKGDMFVITTPNHQLTNSALTYLGENENGDIRAKQYPNSKGNNPIITIRDIKQDGLRKITKEEATKIAKRKIIGNIGNRMNGSNYMKQGGGVEKKKKAGAFRGKNAEIGLSSSVGRGVNKNYFPEDPKDAEYFTKKDYLKGVKYFEKEAKEWSKDPFYDSYRKESLDKAKKYKQFVDKMGQGGGVDGFNKNYEDFKNHIKEGFGYIDKEYVEDSWKNSNYPDYDKIKDELHRRLKRDDLLGDSDEMGQGGVVRKYVEGDKAEQYYAFMMLEGGDSKEDVIDAYGLKNYQKAKKMIDSKQYAMGIEDIDERDEDEVDEYFEKLEKKGFGWIVFSLGDRQNVILIKPSKKMAEGGGVGKYSNSFWSDLASVTKHHGKKALESGKEHAKKQIKKGFTAAKKHAKKHATKAVAVAKQKTKQGFGKAKSYVKSKLK